MNFIGLQTPKATACLTQGLEEMDRLVASFPVTVAPSAAQLQTLVAPIAAHTCILKAYSHLYTVWPLIIESLWTKKRVSTGAFGALDDPVVVQSSGRLYLSSLAIFVMIIYQLRDRIQIVLIQY